MTTCNRHAHTYTRGSPARTPPALPVPTPRFYAFGARTPPTSSFAPGQGDTSQSRLIPLLPCAWRRRVEEGEGAGHLTRRRKPVEPYIKRLRVRWVFGSAANVLVRLSAWQRSEWGRRARAQEGWAQRSEVRWGKVERWKSKGVCSQPAGGETTHAASSARGLDPTTGDAGLQTHSLL